MNLRAWIVGAVLGCALCGCAKYDYTGSLNIRPAAGIMTRTGEALAGLPAPAKPVSVAVYDFQDLTGQNKSTLNAPFAEFSRAITQGASVILVDALKTAGGGSWFNVAERGYLDSLLRERRLIQETYEVLKKNPRTLIDPLNFADYLVTGGIVSYDAPISSANASAGYAGYAAGFAGAKNLVSVNVRLVRVRDGAVVRSINVTRPIVAISASGSVARVLGSSIVDAQAGIGLTEATQTAVRESIETAVYELIRQNVNERVWLLRDEAAFLAETRSPARMPGRDAALPVGMEPDATASLGHAPAAPIAAAKPAPTGEVRPEPEQRQPVAPAGKDPAGGA